MAPRPKEGLHARRPRNGASQDGEFKRRKRNKPNPFEGGKPMPKKHSVAPLKTRIRDLRRQLERVERLPADVRVAHERELAACENELAATEAAIRKDKMLARYKMVRFFESQKATRHLNKIKRQLEQSTDPSEQATLQQQAHIAEVDLNYTKFYPWLQPYVSMYPKKEKETEGKPASDNETNSTGIKGDPTMWKLVEKAMADGTLEALRDGSQTQPLQIRSKPSRSSRSTTPQVKDASTDRPGRPSKARERGRPAEDQDVDMDDKSDDGFFEKGDR